VRIRLADVEPSPDVFASVMATGVLSIVASRHDYVRISETMRILAALGLVILVVVVIVTRRLSLWNLKDPDVTLRLFTFVAACAVLDTRLSSNVSVLRVLGAVALSSWLVLIVLSARNMWAHRGTMLRDHAHGAWELASVGTSGLAIVMAALALHTGHRWWLAIALPVWVAAILIYGLMTWLILWRAVNERQDRDGFEPDSWILMGGLAIATLARRPDPRPGSRLAGRAGAGGNRRDVGGGHPVDTAADLLWAAPDQPAGRPAAVRRCVVGVGVPAGHVLRRHVRHGDRDRAAIAAHRFAGLLLGRVGRVADCGPRRAAAVAPRPESGQPA
jgi:Voltage-dependent anion channel